MQGKPLLTALCPSWFHGGLLDTLWNTRTLHDFHFDVARILHFDVLHLHGLVITFLDPVMFLIFFSSSINVFTSSVDLLHLQWPNVILVLTNHGWLGPVPISNAGTQPHRASWTSPASASWPTVLSTMVWAHASSDFAFSEYVAPSVSTSVGNEPVWTLYDGKNGTRLHPCCRPAGPVISFHQHLHRHPHQPCHILHLLVQQLHLARQLYHVHRHNHAPRAPLSPFISASSIWDPSIHLTKRSLEYHEATRTYGFDLNPHRQEDKDHYDNQKVNVLTFPRTIRQSAFSQKLDIEGCDPLNPPLAALLYQQAATTSGFGSWLMAVKYTWSLPGTPQQLYSWQSSWRSSETKESTWTRSPTVELGKMANWWTRPTTPSMPLNRSPISFTVGYPPAQPIRIPNMS